MRASTLASCLSLVLAVPCVAQEAPDEASPNPVSQDEHGLRPPHETEELVARARRARELGLEFLVATQNTDGSWGSHDPRIANLRDFGFPLLDRGAQDGVRTACTAICAQALMDLPTRTPEQEDALLRAIDELLVPRKFAFRPGGTFNTWGYGYKLDFLNRLFASERGAEMKDEIRTAATVCIDGLKKYQQHQGGWGYYAGPMNDFSSMSFNTAFFASALKRARDLGVSEDPKIPEMVADSLKIVETAEFPDGSFSYYGNHKQSTGMALENLGAGSRSVVCALALHDLGKYDDAALARSLEVFDNGENYLESGRKLIIPHSAEHKISGYFFFYGYAYATEVALRLGDAVDQARWDRFAWTMLRTQEENGSWWDTPAGDYGDKWGTGFALICLNRYLAHTEG